MTAVKALLFITTLTIYSCKDEYTICDLSKDVNLKTVFYEKVAGAERVATAPSFSLKQIGLTDFIYKNSPNVSRFNISLNPLTDTVKFFLSISASAPADTVTFIYSTSLQNLSPACGVVYVNTLTKVYTTINTLDSIKISGSAINTTSGENVKIYF